MTAQEANALVDDFSFVYNGKSISKEALIECREVIHKALEKQIPKQPIKKTGAECGMYLTEEYYRCCPTCGKPVEVDDDELWNTICYPSCECGQRIKYDWERDEE